MKLTDILRQRGLNLKPCTFTDTVEYGNPDDWPKVEEPLLYEKGGYHKARLENELEFIHKIACIKDGEIFSQIPGKDEKGHFLEWISQGPVEDNKVQGWIGGMESYIDIINQRIDEHKQEADPRYRMEVQKRRGEVKARMADTFGEMFELTGGGKHETVFDMTTGQYTWRRPDEKEVIEVGMTRGDRELIKDYYELGYTRQEIKKTFDIHPDLIDTYITTTLDTNPEVIRERAEGIRQRKKEDAI